MKGIIDQIFFDENIVIISLNKGTKSISVSLKDCDNNVKSGDFVVYKNSKWMIEPANLELQKDLNKEIKSLFKDMNK